MGGISKSLTLFLVILLAVSVLLMVIPVKANTIPIPSIPEFTAKLVDRSFNAPATTTIDPYTGQTINIPAHRVENYTIDLTIKNQPYIPVIANNGANTSFVYQIQVKGHFAKDWIPMYPFGDGPKMSNTDYTIITYLLLQSEDSYYLTSHDSTTPSVNTITGLPPNASIDFQVEALSGYWTRTIEFGSQHFEAQESGWSPMQTVTIPASSGSTTQTPSPSSSPSTSPTVPELSWLIIIPLLIAVLSITLILRHRKITSLNK
jgi:hypothetical protein